MPGNCKERWLDVFVTKPDTGIDKQPYEFDDQFACSVQSVRMNPNDTSEAAIVNANSEWIMPTWSGLYDQTGNRLTQSDYAPFLGLKEGDLIRIGDTTTIGYTDYLTIVEVRYITKLYNATSETLNIAIIDNPSNLLKPSTGNGDPLMGLDSAENDRRQAAIEATEELASSDSYTFTKQGIAHIALRLNISLNCTALPKVPLDSEWKTSSGLNGVIAAGSLATLPKRHMVTMSRRNNSRIDSNKYYPLYVNKSWLAGTTLRAALDHGVKQVSCIKLIGYAVHNKRQVGLQHAHEVQADDYLVLRINEIEGHVVSNNRFVNGAFAVLYCGATQDNTVGAIEYSQFDTSHGITVQNIDATNSVIRNLTLDVTDRLGRAAHFGRLHLWFKLLVTHG